MLDLKAQLAAAGLVTKEQIQAVEAKARRSRRSSGSKGAKSRGRRAKSGKGKGLDRAALEAVGKGERYEMIRRAVNASRLDSSGPIPSADSEPFHFAGDGGVVGRVFVEAPIKSRLESGHAAIVTYMSNHGLAHAVVPAALGREIAAVFPEWLCLLQSGKVEGQVRGQSGTGRQAKGEDEGQEVGQEVGQAKGQGQDQNPADAATEAGAEGPGKAPPGPSEPIS